MSSTAARGDRRGPLTVARISPPTRRSLLRGTIAFRWLTILWAVAVFGWEVWRRPDAAGGLSAVERPLVGFALLGAAVGLTAVLTVLYRRNPDLLVRPIPVYAEIGIAATMLLADSWVYGSADHPQTLPSIWAVGAVTAVAIAGGRRLAVITGLGMGTARYVGLLTVVSSADAAFQGVSTMVLLAVTGWVIGYLLRRLAETDRAIAGYRARAEVARTLHDGVLQTLAVIQRRSGDDELVALARTQELELREFLFGTSSVERDLASGIRRAARRAEERFELRVDVVAAPDLPAGEEAIIDRLSGAVGEALTNASKHGRAATATIYAEPADDDTVFVSIKDDGSGFDAEQRSEGEGIRRSIRGRVAEVGGRVEIDGRPGRGTEVRIWVPVSSADHGRS